MIDLNAVSILPMRESDLVEIQDIEEMEYAGDDTYMVEDLRSIIESTSNNIKYRATVARYNGQVVGYQIILIINSMEFIKSIMRFYVVEDYRRMGVGSLLMSATTPKITGDRVMVEIPEDDYGFAAFLRKNGFIVTEVVANEYEEDVEVEMEGYFSFTNEKKARMTRERRNLWRAK